MVRKANQSVARHAQVRVMNQRYLKMASEIGNKFIPNFDLDTLLGKSRDEYYVLLRSGLCWYFRKVEDQLFQDIAKVVNRDHATIIHNATQYAQRLENKEPVVVYFHTLLEKYIKAKYRKDILTLPCGVNDYQNLLLPPLVSDYHNLNFNPNVNFKALPR